MKNYKVYGGPYDGGDISAVWIDARLRKSTEAQVVTVPLQKGAYYCPVEGKNVPSWTFVAYDKDADIVSRYRVCDGKLVHAGKAA